MTPVPRTAPEAGPGAAPAPQTSRGPRRAAARARRWWPRLLLGTALLWLLYTAARPLLSGRWWFWNGIGLAPPVAFVVGPLLLLAAYGLTPGRTRRPPLAAAGAAAAALLLGAPQAGLHPGALFRTTPAAPADALHVVNWNTFFWHQDADPDDFYAYLREQDADVYLLQEYQFARGDVPAPVDERQRLADEFPEYEISVAGEFLTLSRYPVVSEYALRPEGLPPPDTDWADYWDIRVLRTDVEVDGRILSLYNTHLPDLLNVDRNILTPAYHRSVRELATRREVHIAALKADLDANPAPVVLAGDLNILPGAGELRSLDGLRDAARSGGSPYPATFPAGSLPLWRLDWAFASPEIEVHRHDLLDPPGDLSTHRLISLALTLPAPPAAADAPAQPRSDTP